MAVVGLLAVGAVGCGPWESEQHRTVSYEVTGPVTELRVDGDTGGIRVTAGDGPAQVVEKRSWREREPQAVHTLADGVLQLTYSCSDCGVDYQVRVPAGTKLRLVTDTGDVRVRDVTGDVEVKVDTGGIDAQGLGGGSVRLRSGTGDVSAGFTAAPTAAEVRSDTGSVGLTVPAGQPYAVDAHTDTGDSRVSVPTQAGAARTLVARTGTGNVRVSTG
ncbi:hypothetical protein KSE_31980 [Kitasatospora setae KM-6054]|uniref:DUF4097 domain-containing protein n=1 Tax=Kitasatospora setae (strain ATCC 33774 / DSM 43861 / JCM 3304 / KCC A-0304 / NBRC 14216 / KM-6054) TaxID=452652 RepID=E4NCS7_KITSK|nr:hypothetical protein KSE_31980 [Kitasatospora setae KM-6054]